MQDLTDRRIRYWTIVLALAGPFAFFVVRVLLNFAGGPIVVVALILFLCGAIVLLVSVTWAGLAALDLTAVVIAVYEQAWRRTLSSAVLLALILATALNLRLAWRFGDTAGDYVHLLALYPRYMAEISDLPAPRFKAWQWDFVGPCGSGVAYDESDAIVSNHREKIIGTSSLDVHGNARAFGHFYFVTFC